MTSTQNPCATPLPTLSPGDRLAEQLATWFGCGRSPVAPGTVGSLGALPLGLVLARAPWMLRLGAWAALVATALWSSGRVSRLDHQRDPRRVVIDEVTGTITALGLVSGRGPAAALLSFVLFRWLDMKKPGPIRRAEQVEPAALAIVLDDLLAGLAAGVVARLIAR